MYIICSAGQYRTKGVEKVVDVFSLVCVCVFKMSLS